MRFLPLIAQCPQVIAPNAVDEHMTCDCCNLHNLCYQFNCGHFICNACILASLPNQLVTGNVPICPAPQCLYFIDYSTLPTHVKIMYLTSMLTDYVGTIDKRSLFEKCVDMAWSHKKKVISCVATVAVFGFCFYKVKHSEEENPFQAFVLRSGMKAFKKLSWYPKSATPSCRTTSLDRVISNDAVLDRDLLLASSFLGKTL